MDQVTRVFIDTSKSVFQLHGVNGSEQPVLRRKLRRSEMVTFFGQLPPTVVGLEACGGSHHWARVLSELGHQAKLIAPQHVTPYVKRNKNDARDAEGGCEAMSRPTMGFVPIKTAEAQAGLMLMGVRERLVRQRTQLTNAIRGHAAEFGLVGARGLDKIEPLLARLAEATNLPVLARELFAELACEYAGLGERLKALEARLKAWHRVDADSRRLAQIPTVGPIGACLLVMKTPDPKSFRSGRHFAAWIGLTPKDHSTAGKQRLGVITRAGDETLRCTLVSGAMAVIQQAQRRPDLASPWLVSLLKRKPAKLAAVALANKTARIAWRLLVTGEDYDPGRSRAEPARAAT